MALMSATLAFDYRNILEMVEFTTTTSVISTARIQQSDSFIAYNLTGSGLAYDGTNLSGTMTGLQTSYGGLAYFSLSGVSFNLSSDVGDTGYQPIDYPEFFGWKARLSSMLAGADQVNGSSYADRLAGFNGNDTIFGNAGNDSLEGGAGADVLHGGVGLDTLVGGAGNDTLRGDAGDDILTGGVGNDSLDGGAGLDWANYAGGGAVRVNLALATNQAVSSSFGTDQITGIENVRGGSAGDTITGNSAANVLHGQGGNDTLDGGAGIDWSDYSRAGGAVTVNLSLATNQATGYDGTDQLSNIEAVRGSNYNDALTGSAGNNFLSGLRGNDTINGGAGIDRADYDEATGAVVVNLALAANQATGADGTDQLVAIENLRGSAFNDVLRGAAGRNVIEGMAGNDIISGAADADRLIGGLGNDIFDFNLVTESGITASTWDTIVDLVRGQDRIDLSGIDANSANGAGTNEAFTSIIAGTAAFTAAGQLKLSAGVLYGNTDGDATAEFAIALTGITAVASADFIM